MNATEALEATNLLHNHGDSWEGWAALPPHELLAALQQAGMRVWVEGKLTYWESDGEGRCPPELLWQIVERRFDLLPLLRPDPVRARQASATAGIPKEKIA